MKNNINKKENNNNKEKMTLIFICYKLIDTATLKYRTGTHKFDP